jgi:hypothetical protein
MAHDDRRGPSRRYGYDEEQEEARWRGEDAFGRGWGNQALRPQRLGDRGWRGPPDDSYAGTRRYGAGAPAGYGGAPYYGPVAEDSGLISGGPGLDPGFGGPRFDRIDAGSTGTQGVHPAASASSPAYESGPGGYAGAARTYEIFRHDPHYAEWRRRQIAELDRDYEDYRRERQSRFDREFGSWRETRGRQREAVRNVAEHMEVVGSDGAHVGTVDKVRGEHIVLTKSDPDAGGVHHAIPFGWIDRVDDKVVLNMPAEEARERWRIEGRNRALFEREDSGLVGPHVLGRSFSGTYSDEE